MYSLTTSFHYLSIACNAFIACTNNSFKMFFFMKLNIFNVNSKRCIMWRFISLYSSFLPSFLIEKSENTEKDHFDKQRDCKAPIGWSKYTTVGSGILLNIKFARYIFTQHYRFDHETILTHLNICKIFDCFSF